MNDRDELLCLMESVSEAYWSAGWIIGLDESLWIIVTEKPDSILSEDVASLRDLIRRSGGWWMWPGDTEDPVFVTLGEWCVNGRAVPEWARGESDG